MLKIDIPITFIKTKSSSTIKDNSKEPSITIYNNKREQSFSYILPLAKLIPTIGSKSSNSTFSISIIYSHIVVENKGKDSFSLQHRLVS